MKTRYRRSIGTKNIKANCGKNGINSFTFKFGPLSFNTKSRNITVRSGLKGLSFIFPTKKK